jgi:DNA processing protein
MKVKSARRPQPKPDKSISEGRTSDGLSHEERLARLRLIRTPNIGGVTFWELLSHFGSATRALDALPEFAKYGSRVLTHNIPPLASVEAELERAHAAGIALCASGEPGYPPLLAEVEVPPPFLYVKGSCAIWDRPTVAVVGSRQASAAGLKLAAEIGGELGRRGYAIISGLARGIDAAAHRGSLPYGTCAVLPGGLDVIYPPEHSALAAEIVQNGVLISECPPGFIARSQDFPRRNRIISGCSLGVVVVEAAERSGSLITARLAGEQNREVFAVPGHPFEPRAAGTNRLIKEGAIFTTGADDVDGVLSPLLAAWKKEAKQIGGDNERRNTGRKPTLDGGRAAEADSSFRTPLGDDMEFLGEAIGTVLQLLSFAPIDPDDLCRLSGLDARYVHAALLSLDLSGRIERYGARKVMLKA